MVNVRPKMPELPEGFRWRLRSDSITVWRLKLQEKCLGCWWTLDSTVAGWSESDLCTDIETAAKRLVARQETRINPGELQRAMGVVNGR